VKNFIERWSNIKIAINLQAAGNYFIHPFSDNNGANELLHQSYPKADMFYQNIF